MPIILRKFQTFPIMQPDGSFVDVGFATIAFVDPVGNQYAQLNVHADEVAGFNEGDHLVFAPGEGHGLIVPDDHGQMIESLNKAME